MVGDASGRLKGGWEEMGRGCHTTETPANSQTEKWLERWHSHTKRGPQSGSPILQGWGYRRGRGRKALTERLSASAPCWPWRHAVSFLWVLWETCFTSSRRFSTCRESSGDGGRACHHARLRSEVGPSIWTIVGGESSPCSAETSIAGETTPNAGELEGARQWQT